jgi:cell volume regulation protein A
MSELADFPIIVLFVTGAISFAIVATHLGDRLPIPVPALFLVGASIVPTVWPGLRENLSARTVEGIAVVALVVILLASGMDIGWRRFRAAGGPAIVLMIGVVEWATHDDATLWAIVKGFVLEMNIVLEMSIGLAFGLMAARLATFLRRVHLPSEGLYPVLLALLGAVLYAVTSLCGGSGLLAIFVAGLFLADAPLPYKREVERFNGWLARLAEIVILTALGLIVDIGGLSTETWLHGVAVWLVLLVFARPSSVALTLTRSSIAAGERAFSARDALEGAMPSLLAAIAILGSVNREHSVYGIAFVVILLSVVGPGKLFRQLAGVKGVPIVKRPLQQRQLSIALSDYRRGAYELTIASDPAADRRTVALDLDRDDCIGILVRDGPSMCASVGLDLAAGDRVVVLADPSQRRQLELSLVAPN